jgi:hypothetical protein
MRKKFITAFANLRACNSTVSLRKKEVDFINNLQYSASGKFPLGAIVATPSILDLLTATEIFKLLDRHSAGDWGDLCDSDKKMNDKALISNDKLFSAYVTSTRKKVWIVTEASRSVTTIMLPSEY